MRMFEGVIHVSAHQATSIRNTMQKIRLADLKIVYAIIVCASLGRRLDTAELVLRLPIVIYEGKF